MEGHILALLYPVLEVPSSDRRSETIAFFHFIYDTTAFFHIIYEGRSEINVS